MVRQQKALLVVTVVLVLVGLAGYLWPSPKKMPVRILFENKGGDMAFSHLTHTDSYGIACSQCHHEGGDMSNVLECGRCHPVSFTPQFKKDHQTWFSEKWQCLRCHHAEEPETPEGEFQNCLVCHEDTALDELIPTRTDAFHGRCMGCHEELGAGPFGEKECKTCHVR